MAAGPGTVPSGGAPWASRNMPGISLPVASGSAAMRLYRSSAALSGSPSSRRSGRAGTGQRGAPVALPPPAVAGDVVTAQRQRQRAAAGRDVMVVDVPVAQRGPHHPLGDGAPEAVPGAVRVTVVREAIRQSCASARSAGPPPREGERRRPMTAVRRRRRPSPHVGHGGWNRCGRRCTVSAWGRSSVPCKVL